MSTLTYQHALNGKGVGAGLPLRRASKLYHVEPNLVYPNAFSTGLDSDLGAYHKGIFLRTPHLPITRLIEPYIDNHKAGGTFTRRQFFVIKRGQPLMASTKRQGVIGLIDIDGSVSEKLYNHPARMASQGKFAGYSNDGGTTVLTQAEFDAVAEADKAGYREVYTGLEDTNDKIATGGVDMRAELEAALTGSTDLVTFVEIDADSFYFGAASKSDGWIAPSTGGFDRTVFYNEVDAEAGVTLPTDGTGANPRLVNPIGNTTDVRADNLAAYRGAATVLPARPTIGFAHTDLDQATSFRFHMFQTGLDVHSPMRKGQHMVPFIDVVKLKAVVAEALPTTPFDFTDIGNGKSGLKVGASVDPSASEAKKASVRNRYSLLTAADAGYANLHYNFGAPFLTVTRAPGFGDVVVPDLFGNFVLKGSGLFRADATVADTEAEFGLANDGTTSYGLTADELAANVDGAQAVSDDHRCGKVVNIFDMPEQSMLKYVVNNQPHLRQTNDFVSEMYSRVRSADTAGLEPILADIILMTLGGSSYDWASSYIPMWDGRRATLATVLERLVIEGAFGMVEIASNVITD